MRSHWPNLACKGGKMRQLKYSYQFKEQGIEGIKTHTGFIEKREKPPMAFHAINQPLVSDQWVQIQTCIERIEQLESALEKLSLYCAKIPAKDKSLELVELTANALAILEKLGEPA